jgi:type II secretory pathway pseudopilin PulG
MQTTRSTTQRERSTAGYSLVEMLVAVGIIMVLGAVSAPAIINWSRNYEIRGATRALAGDIQTARTRAIAKNVNFGVAIVVQNPTTYWTHIEDDLTLPRTTVRQTLDFAVPDNVQSTRRVLPQGIEFAANAADCPAIAGFAPAEYGFRFNRLGAWCDPGGSAVCPEVPTNGPFLTPVRTDANGSTICLVERRTGLSRTVTVTPGGRVLAQP